MVVPIYVIPAISLLHTKIYSFGRCMFTLKRLSAALPGSFQVINYNPNHPLIGLG
jgi:hypothetical protein